MEKTVEIEVIEKREVVKDIKDYLVNLLKNMGYSLPPHIYTVKYGANAILEYINGGGKNV